MRIFQTESANWHLKEEEQVAQFFYRRLEYLMILADDRKEKDQEFRVERTL